MASFNERVGWEWQNISNSGGNGFVPDVSVFMSLETMKDNLNKINYWITHYSQQPVPSNLLDLYNKEVNGTGSSITAKIAEIIAYLRTKQALYQQAIAAKEPSAPVYTETKPQYDPPAETETDVPTQLPTEEPSFLKKNALPLAIAATLLINAILPPKKRFIKF